MPLYKYSSPMLACYRYQGGQMYSPQQAAVYAGQGASPWAQYPFQQAYGVSRSVPYYDRITTIVRRRNVNVSLTPTMSFSHWIWLKFIQYNKPC